jgi:hypothetical protein
LAKSVLRISRFQGSTYSVLDLDGELAGHDWDVPHCDPDLVAPPFLFADPDAFSYGDDCPGAPGLGDQLSINGLVVPFGAHLSRGKTAPSGRASFSRRVRCPPQWLSRLGGLHGSVECPKPTKSASR